MNYWKKNTLEGKASFNVGDMVYIHDQLEITGPHEVKKVTIGCPCCSLHEDAGTIYYMFDNWDTSEDYVFGSEEEATLDLERWQDFRRKHGK